MPISESHVVPVHDYEDITATKYFTDIQIRTFKESTEVGLVDKILKRDKEEPKTEIIKEEGFRYEVTKEGFIQNPGQITNENQPDINKLIEKTCKLIVEKGRPTYEEKQKKEAENRRLKQEEEKVNKDIAVNKIIANTMKDFLG